MSCFQQIVHTFWTDFVMIRFAFYISILQTIFPVILFFYRFRTNVAV